MTPDSTEIHPPTLLTNHTQSFMSSPQNHMTRHSFNSTPSSNGVRKKRRVCQSFCWLICGQNTRKGSVPGDVVAGVSLYLLINESKSRACKLQSALNKSNTGFYQLVSSVGWWAVQSKQCGATFTIIRRTDARVVSQPNPYGPRKWGRMWSLALARSWWQGWTHGTVMDAQDGPMLAEDWEL